MGLERRSRADQGQPGANPPGEEPGARPEPKVKSFEIGKRLIVEAWEKVRASNGAPGVDAVGIGLFQEQLWAMRKFKRFRGKYAKAMAWLQKVYQYKPGLFAHWQLIAFT